MYFCWSRSSRASLPFSLSLSLFASLLVSLALSRHFLDSSSFSLFLSKFPLSLSFYFFPFKTLYCVVSKRLVVKEKSSQDFYALVASCTPYLYFNCCCCRCEKEHKTEEERRLFWSDGISFDDNTTIFAAFSSRIRRKIKKSDK